MMMRNNQVMLAMRSHCGAEDKDDCIEIMDRNASMRLLTKRKGSIRAIARERAPALSEL